MFESVMCLFLLIVGFFEQDTGYFIAAGAFAVAGRIGAFLDMLLYAEEEDGQ